ncbi:hypothetical protein TNCV_2460241 [Trichonephila clavipes]|nr:hypothetical protein TNCV_2460241 [Trichonephila clavipes]
MRNPIPHQTTILGAGPVWRMHSATVQKPLATVSPNSNPIIVMCPAEEGFVSKHNVVLFHCPCLPFIVSFATQTPVVSSQEKKRNGRLAKIHSAANGVERYERKPNAA